MLQGAHPDLQWYFPRPRLKDADPDVDDVIEDLTGAIGERLEGDGWWAPPEPMDSLYVATIRALVRRAALTPALADRKVIVVADADRMVPQEGREEAANAFLKLLEEPPRNTTVVLTSSAPGALLPTIRSRAVAIRVPLPTGDAAREIASHRAAPGASAASRTAASLLDAAVDPGARYRAALAQSGAGARGAYTETLNALSGLLHERTRAAAARGREDSARNTARAIAFVEDAKQLARQNVNPQVITARLLADLAPLVS